MLWIALLVEVIHLLRQRLHQRTTPIGKVFENLLDRAREGEGHLGTTDNVTLSVLCACTDVEDDLITFDASKSLTAYP